MWVQYAVEILWNTDTRDSLMGFRKEEEEEGRRGGGEEEGRRGGVFVFGDPNLSPRVNMLSIHTLNHVQGYIGVGILRSTWVGVATSW